MIKSMKNVNQVDQEILAELKVFANELNEMFSKGMDLREISKYTYQQRESGRNVPYFGISDIDKVTKKVTRISAAPTSNQKKLRQFFNIKFESGINGLYMYIDIEDGIVHLRGTGKTNKNFILI
jgi:hypothetical protein